MQAASRKNEMDGICFKDGGNAYTLTRCSTNSVLFSKFIKGCEKRMGRVVKQDIALSVSVLLLILDNLNKELQNGATNIQRKREIVMLGSLLVIGFCDGLRGNELFLVEASSLCYYGDKGEQEGRAHVVIPLMGRFKGETGERNVLRPLVKVTASGIEINRWVSRLIRVLKVEGRQDRSKPGPAFCDDKGDVLAYSFMNGLFHQELIRIQDTHSDKIPPDVEVGENYNIYRLLRRGATSRATELNYSETIINLNNRWRTTQSNKGKGGIKKMSQLYVEIALVTESLLKFSASL
jgi:hypothetical protein